MSIYDDRDAIIRAALAAVRPGPSVERALAERSFGTGRLRLLAAGKAAWEMAAAAQRALGNRIESGLVVTKHGHSRGALPGLELREAGHPVPDAASFAAGEAALSLCDGLGAGDAVLLLLSGGASALLEAPLIPPEELADITRRLLRGGANIAETNAVRKHLSRVKGGRLAERWAPVRVECLALSDVLGDDPSVIASGPAWPDRSTCAEARAAAKKYALPLSPLARAALSRETPKALDNVRLEIVGGVGRLCAAAERECRARGYETRLLTASLAGEAREAGERFAALAAVLPRDGRARALLAGGETVVHVTGDGLGGRCQELALAAAPGLRGLPGTLLFALGSDGTDGPTDAAGGWADGETCGRLAAAGFPAEEALRRNDAYHALAAAGCLLITGPTGTNVNDLVVLLQKTEKDAETAPNPL